jgi:molecular chaperone GrpE
MTYEDLSRSQLVELVEELETLVDRAEARQEEWEHAAKKVKADFENYKKKQDERKQRWQRKAEQDLAADLIEVIDNMERALMAAEEDSAVFQGVKMVADQLYEALEKRGIKRIDPLGEEFDPKLHNAVEVEQHDKHNHVLDTKRAGYIHGETVLRPAEVVVGKNTED